MKSKIWEIARGGRFPSFDQQWMLILRLDFNMTSFQRLFGCKTVKNTSLNQVFDVFKFHLWMRFLVNFLERGLLILWKTFSDCTTLVTLYLFLCQKGVCMNNTNIMKPSLNTARNPSFSSATALISYWPVWATVSSCGILWCSHCLIRGSGGTRRNTSTQR